MSKNNGTPWWQFVVMAVVVTVFMFGFGYFLWVAEENIKYEDEQDGLRGASVERTTDSEGREIVCITSHSGFSPDMECVTGEKP